MALRTVCLLVLLAGACRVSEPGTPPLPPVGDGSGLPPRTVVEDYPPGLSQSLPEAGSRDVAAAPDGAADAPELPDAAITDDAAITCSLLAQDCVDAGQGCYPGGTGSGECRPAGLLPEGTNCLERHEECRKGLVCVDAFGLGQGRTCQRLCDPASEMSCKPGPKCQAFPASSVGWCPP